MTSLGPVVLTVGLIKEQSGACCITSRTGPRTSLGPVVLTVGPVL